MFEDLSPSRLDRGHDDDDDGRLRRRDRQRLVLERLLPAGPERRVRRLFRERPVACARIASTARSTRSSIPRRVESCAARTCRRSAASRRSRKRRSRSATCWGSTVFADPESNRGCIPFDPFATHLPPEVIDYMTGGIHHDQELTQDVIEVTLQTDIGEDRPQGSISVGGGVSYRDEQVFQDAFGSRRRSAPAARLRRVQQLPGPQRIGSRFAACRASCAIAASSSRAIRTARVRSRASSTSGRCSASRSSRSSATPTAASSCTSRRAMPSTPAAAAFGPASSAATGASTRRSGCARRSRATRARARCRSGSTRRAPARTSRSVRTPYCRRETYIAGLTTGGNPEIRPELADTTTVGVVWQPNWAEDFNLSVDLYDIEIQDAIAQLGTQEILDRCYLQGAQDICALISRNDTGTPFIRQILNVFINIAETKTSGIDIETSWRKDMRIFGGGDESIGDSLLRELSRRGVVAVRRRRAAQRGRRARATPSGWPRARSRTRTARSASTGRRVIATPRFATCCGPRASTSRTTTSRAHVHEPESVLRSRVGHRDGAGVLLRRQPVRQGSADGPAEPSAPRAARRRSRTTTGSTRSEGRILSAYDSSFESGFALSGRAQSPGRARGPERS